MFTGRITLLRCAAVCVLWAVPAASWHTGAAAQTGGGPDLSLELVDPEVLRVCADPGNMPFSNDKEEGFENRIAELFAEKLGKGLSYTWFPQVTGFVRNTLGAHRCDVIIGFAQGGELAQSTNPYYRSVYAFVLKPGSELEDVDTLADPRLKGKKLGVVAGTPPASYMVRNALMKDARPYHLLVDTRINSSAKEMIADLVAGEIDAAVLWGPMAGYFASRSDPPLIVTPLLKEAAGPRLAYYITMGVRLSDQEWKRQLNGLIRENQSEINRILLSYGVPLLDGHNQLIEGE